MRRAFRAADTVAIQGTRTMRDISYEEQTVNAPNPLARFAHRTRMVVALDLAIQACPEHATVLDFGAGPGLFLHTLGQARRDVHLIGHDPFVASGFPEIKYADSFNRIDDTSVDVLTAFEVCEHLYPQEIDQLLEDASRVMKPNATLIISVPIMYGVAVIPKVLNWMVRHRKSKTEYSVPEILQSAIGTRVSRPENPRGTHKGFDFRELRDTVEQRFTVSAVRHSPVKWLPWWLSSQYFMICRKAA
ncbi:methyltransferase domain-containing protein [Paraburkholderia sp. DHOC27]|uniref:class I SAM-dependent methyltransferase n=1 Tax=Paraburkholderia sp. DHOC27 TaxID=2303330 RepID=UPI000E3B9EFC|nr:methyltransferase domain-containing protein [Paraburkholderia sp. DHOC27]RFU47642.1 class I SAM-dependent methyltransferase [Paraburkholderia sp. DHOC27]